MCPHGPVSHPPSGICHPPILNPPVQCPLPTQAPSKQLLSPPPSPRFLSHFALRTVHTAACDCALAVPTARNCDSPRLQLPCHRQTTRASILDFSRFLGRCLSLYSIQLVQHQPETSHFRLSDYPPPFGVSISPFPYYPGSNPFLAARQPPWLAPRA